ncbi:MAG TPA: hypothetical protein VM694_38120, partial [Polyangium sp.]|nr:hypothetical protein [Polyangium sp.]
PAVPWLLAGHAAETGMTLADVKASLPADAIVVPGHGRPVSVDGFDFAIDYLGTLVTEVGSAVSSGKTKDEAVMSVSMDSFKGYAIWDWIHTTVNVPNTYDDLSP